MFVVLKSACACLVIELGILWACIVQKRKAPFGTESIKNIYILKKIFFLYFKLFNCYMINKISLNKYIKLIYYPYFLFFFKFSFNILLIFIFFSFLFFVFKT